MTTAIERLYAEFLAATDRAARFASAEYKAHVAQLEKEICDNLATQGGSVTVGNINWALIEVAIGKDRLHYFKVLISHERNPDAPVVPTAPGSGFSFARRQPDISDVVLPVSVPGQKPFSRRATRSLCSRPMR